jgi:hypothetical protein
MNDSRPEGWSWLYLARDKGLVPRSRLVRMALDADVWGREVLRVPPDARADSLDLSLVAGLDVVLIIDRQRAAGWRVRDYCAALVTAGAESLRVLELARGIVATIRVGHPEYRGGYARECA